RVVAVGRIVAALVVAAAVGRVDGDVQAAGGVGGDEEIRSVRGHAADVAVARSADGDERGAAVGEAVGGVDLELAVDGGEAEARVVGGLGVADHRLLR